MAVQKHPCRRRLHNYARLLIYLGVFTCAIHSADSKGSLKDVDTEASPVSPSFVEVNLKEWQRISYSSAEEFSEVEDGYRSGAWSRGKMELGLWGSVIATPWSHRVHGGGVAQARLLLDSVEGRIADEVGELTAALALDEFWHFLVGYRDHDAVERAVELANGTAVLLMDDSGGRWFFLYMKRRTADALRDDPSYHVVEPLPASLKIDAFNLRKKMSAVREGKEVAEHLRGPVSLKAVLAQGALTLVEAARLAWNWQASLRHESALAQSSKKISCRVEDETAVVCEPIEDEVLLRTAEWISEQAVVLSVEIRPPYKTWNKWARDVVQSVSGLKTPIAEMGLRGEGQVIGVADTGIDLNHCFFYDAERPKPMNKIDPEARKVIQYVTFGDDIDSEVGGHGTHVAGSIAGNPLFGDQYAGMAPSAKLAFFDISTGSLEVLLTPINLGSNLFPYAYQAGARIHSNSWGSPAEGYGSDARDVDDYLYKNEDMLILFAGGNDGDTNNGSQTISTPGIAKNVLTVGACMNAAESFGDKNPEYNPSTIAAFSSQGPTSDGRIKPDLVAPGMFVVSSRSQPGVSPAKNCDYEPSQGTSVATPVVAGMAALIRQYFQLGFYPTGVATPVYSFSPSGALMKAMLIHSGETMNLLELPSGRTKKLSGIPGVPDFYQGFGRAVLENVLVFKDPPKGYTQRGALYIRSGRQDNSVVTHGTAHLYRFNITSNLQQLRATLVWTDPPASTNSLKALINDLNLRLIGPDQTSYYPNGGSAPDKVNNVEVISVSAPAVGIWTASIEGTSVCCKGQPYALVLTGPFSPPTGFLSENTPSVPNKNHAMTLLPSQHRGAAPAISTALLLLLYSLVVFFTPL